MQTFHDPKGIPCQLCHRVTLNLATCDECLSTAVSILEAGSIDASSFSYRLLPILELAPTCYLCGLRPSEHSDHVLPKSLGGSDHWSNIGATCAKCNLSKGATDVSLSPEQEVRLADQREVFAAFGESAVSRLGDQVWWQWVEPDIEDYFEEYRDDPGILDQEWVAEDVSDWFEGNSIDPSVVEGLVAFILKAAQEGRFDGERFSAHARTIDTLSVPVDLQAILDAADD